MGGTNITIYGTGFLSSIPVSTPLWIKFGNLEYQKLVKEVVEEITFNYKDYCYDDLKMHPFRLRNALNKLETVTEGKTLQKYQYAISPDLRPLYHRTRHSMDIYIAQRGGPVLVQIGELT